MPPRKTPQAKAKAGKGKTTRVNTYDADSDAPPMTKATAGKRKVRATPANSSDVDSDAFGSDAPLLEKASTGKRTARAVPAGTTQTGVMVLPPAYTTVRQRAVTGEVAQVVANRLLGLYERVNDQEHLALERDQVAFARATNDMARSNASVEAMRQANDVAHRAVADLDAELEALTANSGNK